MNMMRVDLVLCTENAFNLDYFYEFICFLLVIDVCIFWAHEMVLIPLHRFGVRMSSLML